MFNDIPKERLVLWAAIFALLPIFFAVFSWYSAQSDSDALISSLDRVSYLAKSKESKQLLNRSVREHFKEKERYYIDKSLEPLKFLQPEIKSLQTLMNNKNFAGDEKVKQRLDYLTGQDNKFILTEGNIQTYPYFQEVIASLIKPVELNVDDLKKVLSLIEGVEIPPYTPPQDRPQLIITEFKIERKEATKKNEVYQLNLKLLKREYL